MAEQKTKPTAKSVDEFLDDVPNEQMRDDCYTLIKLMQKVTGSKPKMWGPTIVGFGQYHYKYESGHEGYSCLTGFAPRKGNIVLYVMPTEEEARPKALKNLGKHKATKGCIYVKKLEDIDIGVLEKIVKDSVAYTKKKYPDKK